MLEQIAGERESVVGSAKAWLGTQYHHMANRRGIGCDCVTFLRGAFLDAQIGLDIPMMKYYPENWHFHRDVERYMEGLIQYCVEVASVDERPPLPADILLFKHARAYSHGALVIDYPKLIHSVKPRGVEYTDLTLNNRLTHYAESREGGPRPTKVFTLKRWVEGV